MWNIFILGTDADSIKDAIDASYLKKMKLEIEKYDASVIVPLLMVQA